MLIVLFPDQGGDPIQGIEKEMRIYLVSQSIAPTLQTLDAQLLYLLLFFPLLGEKHRYISDKGTQQTSNKELEDQDTSHAIRHEYKMRSRKISSHKTDKR